MAKKRKPTGGGRLELSDADKRRGISLGSRIQSTRNAKGLKQEDLASRSGVRLNTLKSIESGRSFSPSIFTVADLARVLKVGVDEWIK